MGGVSAHEGGGEIVSSHFFSEEMEVTRPTFHYFRGLGTTEMMKFLR